ncbi:GNAT family N-acetyltransferase [Neorhizobium alkalisoli]|uniref:Acetyltransferase (GNAT) family protein n=1 Tax=Neorhizobium alkalisoli TaxID=528178 RepID=A0A561R9G8_9HYPH|nr:GNAT family N-acetyltransferase [Neorhizobium alkalisoli]TWF59275.1 acetyltransferase (GNAT) family protein [Neorhizobium alkalisoli]
MQAGEIETRAFGAEHLDGAVHLSREAGWPHRAEDWQVARHLSQGVVAVDDTGKVVGTALMTPYGKDCATINMVIVDASLRGRGVGRRLMDEALSLGGERPLRLIATADGLPLYEKLGFREIGRVFQHQGTVGALAAPARTEAATAADLSEITTMDQNAFGADRSSLMAKLAEIGEFAVIRRDGRIAGFACIRNFGRGEVVGPVVATSLDDAKALVAHFMSSRVGAFLRLDTGNAELGAWLSEHSLAHVGGGVAMARPATAAPTISTFTTFALANQALG